MGSRARESQVIRMTVTDPVTSPIEEEQFRARVRSFLDRVATTRSEERDAPADVDVALSKAFQSELFAENLAGITWPRRVRRPRPPGSGIRRSSTKRAAGYDLPTLAFGISIRHGGPGHPGPRYRGTEEALYPPALRGEEIWCQLFSEPSSGSDLASVRSSVVRDGDEWILNGQKVWTSGGHYSQQGLLLARSDPDQPKHRGMSMFLLDMSSPGVEVRPLRQMTGRAHFNEVFFDDVHIPVGNIVGEPGDGWRLAITDLMNERFPAAPPQRGEDVPADGDLDSPGLGPKAQPVGDPAIRQALMDLVGPLLGGRPARREDAPIRPGRSGARPRSAPCSSWAGPIYRSARPRWRSIWPARPGRHGPTTRHEEQEAVDMILNSRSTSIAGGSNQVMRNILGERVLGLPKEHREDRDLRSASYPSRRKAGPTEDPALERPPEQSPADALVRPRGGRTGRRWHRPPPPWCHRPAPSNAQPVFTGAVSASRLISRRASSWSVRTVKPVIPESSQARQRFSIRCGDPYRARSSTYSSGTASTASSFRPERKSSWMRSAASAYPDSCICFL